MRKKLQLGKDIIGKELIKNGRMPTVDVDEISEQPVDNMVAARDHALVQDLREKLQVVQDKMKICVENTLKVQQMTVQAQCAVCLFRNRLNRLKQFGSSRSSKRKRRGDESRQLGRSRSSKRKRRGDESRCRRN
ncbi:hypothetical protein MKX03_024813 [Papaver bracteatum]|nr:hypothetical protein MKX03_024813 [Papaver bracteatum]